MMPNSDPRGHICLSVPYTNDGFKNAVLFVNYLSSYFIHVHRMQYILCCFNFCQIKNVARSMCDLRFILRLCYSFVNC